jgi:hypothetical protein
MNKISNSPEAVKFKTLYDVDSRLVTDGGVDYIDPRPLCAMATLNWPTVEATLLAGDGITLYGTKLLSSPNIPFDERPKGSDRPSPFIRVDRLHLLLMRIDTAKMRWRGKAEQADQLLEDQICWAETLHGLGPK